MEKRALRETPANRGLKATITEPNAQNGVPYNRVPHTVVPLAAAHPVPAPKLPTEKGKTAAISDTQPVTVEGVRNLLAASGDLPFSQSPASLSQAREFLRLHAPDVLLIDKVLGIQAILDFLNEAGQRWKRRRADQCGDLGSIGH
jgi:hypothetical protein